MQAQMQSLKVFSNEPNWLLEYRERNLAIVKAEPLQKSKYSNLAELSKLLNHPVSKTLVPGPSELEQIDGVRVLEWQEALSEFESELKFALENERIPSDQYEAFVNSRFNSGFVLAIEKTLVKDSLLHWQTVVSSGAVAKTVVLVKPNCENVHLLEQVSSQQGRINQTILLGENSKAVWVRLMDLSLTNLISQQSVLEKDANLHCANAWQTTPLVRNHSSNVLLGAGSQSKHRDWVLGGGTERLDLNVVALHAALATQSHCIFKAVLDDSAYVVFDGMIKILPVAQQTNAWLEAHGFLLSPNASNNNIPGLEIEADDVKATHSATVAQLDEEALFYLRSRGLTKVQAKHMIVTGFLEALIHELPPAFGPILTESVEHKWLQLNQNKY